MTTQIRRQDGITILEPSGKIVGSSASELRKAISPQIEAYDEPRVLINFEHVNRIDSSGLSALIEARVAATRKKGRIGVVNAGKHIRNLVALNRLVSLFECFDNEDAAVSALSA
ncbi:STAS domain-containing protein [Candidatus Poribacteria bacterium]|nr:STAS domain-containing protein [Candidatus Poribacteria bacterium]